MAKRKVKKKALTPTQSAYRKQRKRIQNFISRASKRGYIFPENILPPIPKRITIASVSRLAKLTPERLYKKAQYVSADTLGEIVSAQEGLKLEKQARARKAAETRKKRKAQKAHGKYPKTDEPKQTTKRKDKTNKDTSFFTRAVIETFIYTLETCRGGKAYTLLGQWFSKLRSDNGDDAVADMLQKGSESGYELTWETVYNVEKANDFVQGIIQFLSTQGDFYKDQIDEYWNYISSVENAMFEESNFEIYDI